MRTRVEIEIESHHSPEAGIEGYLRSSAGRSRLAEAMTQPLRMRRDYTAMGRSVFLVTPLPDGALPIYDRDIDAAPPDGRLDNMEIQRG